ncbi:hypothetical protein [Dethiosulfatarculus sandiegensis]|uniref:hypothetical protein n=1 Tax=Dethiosulfatarculus sandiegensis TaxID=1429043 RepID=UPI000697576C|nr:hypothetical protein [Dethiosulfatarculus sandiegensis]
MDKIYLFLAGPGAWVAFVVFGVGILVRLAFLFGISRERDKIFYNHLSWKWGVRSIWHWLLPPAALTYRKKPIFAFSVWFFHLFLLVTPLFLSAHNILLQRNLGFSLWSMPDYIADFITVLFVLIGMGLLLRRLTRPEVRLLSGPRDYVLLLLTLAPFITGFLAYHQVGPYRVMLCLHMMAGEILLLVIPFTKLSHAFLFFPSRFFIGSDMGGRREQNGRAGARTW